MWISKILIQVDRWLCICQNFHIIQLTSFSSLNFSQYAMDTFLHSYNSQHFAVVISIKPQLPAS